MKFDPTSTAVVIIDPQIDVLSPAGRNWAAVVNYRFLAHAVLPTAEIASAMNGAALSTERVRSSRSAVLRERGVVRSSGRSGVRG